MKTTTPPRPLNSVSVEFLQTSNPAISLEPNELAQSALSVETNSLVKSLPATRLLERRLKRQRRFV